MFISKISESIISKIQKNVALPPSVQKSSKSLQTNEISFESKNMKSEMCQTSSADLMKLSSSSIGNGTNECPASNNSGNSGNSGSSSSSTTSGCSGKDKVLDEMVLKRKVQYEDKSVFAKITNSVDSATQSKRVADKSVFVKFTDDDNSNTARNSRDVGYEDKAVNTDGIRHKHTRHKATCSSGSKRYLPKKKPPAAITTNNAAEEESVPIVSSSSESNDSAIGSSSQKQCSDRSFFFFF